MNLNFSPVSSTPDPWDAWFQEDRGTGIDYDEEDDVDEVENDEYNDRDLL